MDSLFSDIHWSVVYLSRDFFCALQNERMSLTNFYVMGDLSQKKAMYPIKGRHN